MTTLLDLFEDLATDPAAKARYAAQPDAYLADNGFADLPSEDLAEALRQAADSFPPALASVVTPDGGLDALASADLSELGISGVDDFETPWEPTDDAQDHADGPDDASDGETDDQPGDDDDAVEDLFGGDDPFFDDFDDTPGDRAAASEAPTGPDATDSPAVTEPAAAPSLEADLDGPQPADLSDRGNLAEDGADASDASPFEELEDPFAGSDWNAPESDPFELQDDLDDDIDNDIGDDFDDGLL